MSQPKLLTIDFLGIGNDKNGSQQLLQRRLIQSSLGKIRPHMLRQVLSHGCLSDSEIFHREFHNDVSEGIKTMDLFPQNSVGFQSNSKDDNKQSLLLDTQTKISEAATTNPSSAQLTIFYKGTVKVYRDVSSGKAEAIVMMAAANGDALLSTTSSNISNSGDSADRIEQSYAIEKSNSKLPMAKKLSLQRFLQKRKDRLSRIIPYATSSK